MSSNNEKKPRSVPKPARTPLRVVSVTSDVVNNSFEIRAMTDADAVGVVIEKHLIPIRDAGALKGCVTVRCGSVKKEMRA